MGKSIRWRNTIAYIVPLVLAIIGGPVCYVLLIAYTIAISFCYLSGKRLSGPWLLYCLALALLWSTTLLSATVVGTDIHAEYRLAWTSWQYGWDYTNIHIYNTSLLAVPFTAAVSKVLHLDPVWLFKICVPMLSAACAPILYRIYRQHIRTAQAYIATLIVVLSPTFLVELLGMARQMTALPFMLITLGLLADNTQWAWCSRKRMVLVVAIGLIASTAHYTTGMILLFLMGFALLFMLVARWLHYDALPLRGPIAVFLAIAILSVGYYSVVGQGIVTYSVAAKVGPFLGIEVESIESMRPPEQETVTLPIMPYTVPLAGDGILSSHERAMQLALGRGVQNGDPLVKVWWIFQYMMQGLVVIGAGYALCLWWKRRQWNTQYMGLIAAAMMLGLLCVVVPAFSALLNATRFWLIILLFLAPAVVAVVTRVVRRTTITLLLLVPYFLLTTGIVFEAAQYDISLVRIPYSIALSNDRIDMGASFTHGDVAARQYIIDNELYPVYTDWYGAMFLTEQIPEENVYWNWPQISTEIVPDINSSDYVYLRARSMEDGLWTEWCGIGTRMFVPYSEAGIDDVLSSRTELYRSGDAVVIDKGHR